MKRNLLPIITMMMATAAQAQGVAYQFRSTDGNYWKMATVSVADKAPGKAQLTIRTAQPRQTFLGWGTCFNELPWDAYNLLGDEEKRLFVKRLFNPNGDLRLQKGRLSVGANDYARDWYSCDEIDADSTDFEMRHFNIERDLTTIIPSIKLALAENPDIDFFASPWSPPTWMKTNKHYAQKKTDTNGCPFSVAPYFNDQFIDDARYYDAYCLYFDKFINAYKEQGISITSLAYQNEAYSNTPYPGCSWTAKTTGKFLADYLGPYMKKNHPGVKLIVGTMNTASLDVYEQILNTPSIAETMDAVGFQWEGGQAINEVLRRHPNYEAIQTESECGYGSFDWKAAAHTFQLANHYLANRVTTYYYWNAILKDKGTSTWGWVQNALVQVNSSTNTPRYTAEYYAYKHYAHLIPAGSKILACDESHLATSALTPDGNVVLVVGNDGSAEKTLTVDVDGKYLTLTLPGKSFTSYVIGQSASSRLAFLKSEAQGLVDVEGASLTAGQTASLTAALAAANGAIADSAAVAQSLAEAVMAVEKDEATSTLPSEIQNPSFTNGSTGWATANVAASGDFRTNTIAGRTCWNNWSNNFTSMDIHQDLGGLTPGAYTLTAYSMCGPGEISDQHAYLVAQCDTATSPVKAVAIWNTTEGWEQQTTAPVVVGTDGTLRVGYASTSGGGTHGWFCVTGFALQAVEADTDIVAQTLAAAINRAEAKADGSLQTLIATAKAATTRGEQLEALTALREAMGSSVDLSADIAAYNAVADSAKAMARNEAYDEEARKQLAALVADYDAWLQAGDGVTASSIADVIRALEEKMAAVALTQKPGQTTDFTYYIKNPGAEAEEGWDLSVTNGDGKRKKSAHYSGDASNYYFDSYNSTAGNLWYTGHQTLTGLPTGTYRLVAAARANGEGAYLTAQTTAQWYQQAIKTNGNTGGDLGLGWSDVEISDIVVTDGTLTIGFTNDYYLTGKKFEGTWMSFDDFRLYYVSESTATGMASTRKANTSTLNVRGGKGCLVVNSTRPVKVYTANGAQVGRTANLAAGPYLVSDGQQTKKILVY